MPARILIVDDDPATLLAISSTVEMRLENAVVDTCESVSAALERISTIDYDVIVSDIKMSETDGFSFIESVLQLRPSTPTFLMTAHEDHDLGVRALNAGAYAFIHKPIDRDFFITWLKRLIQLRRLSRTVEQQNERLERRVQEQTVELEEKNKELQAALEQMCESEQRYWYLLRALPAAIYTCDAQGRVTLYNEAAVALWGREPEIGKDLWCGSWRIYEPDGLSIPLEECPMAVTIREGRAVRGREIVIERPDGTRSHVLPYPEPIRDTSGAVVGAVNMLVDITERKGVEDEVRRLLSESQAHERALRDKQDQLVQAAKLASLGELASGVAHELNNPLNNINLLVGNVTHLLQEAWIDRERIVYFLRMAKEQVQKAATIISHLRTFARTSGSARERVGVNHVIQSTLMLLTPQLRLLSVDITTDLAAEDPMVFGNAIQLEQVIINLLTNARDAVEPTSCKHIALGTAVRNGHVEIRVQDSGVGIPIELQPRIFDPFFTTKAVGHGTGLGLSISYGIIKEHGGEITVDSRPGEGATFLIQLPLAEPSPS